MKKTIFTGAATAALVMTTALTSASASASDMLANTSSSAAISLSGDVANDMKMGGHMPKPNMGAGHMPHPPMVVHMPRPHTAGNNVPSGIRVFQRPFRGAILPSYWFNRGYVYNSTPNLRLNSAPIGYVPAGYAPAGYAPQGGYQPTYAPTIRPDAQAYDWGDDGSAPTQGSNRQAGTYEGEWNGRYVDPQGKTYQGEWEGTYTGEDGRRYEGTYRGTATGAPVINNGRTAGAPYETGAYQNRPADRYEYENDSQTQSYKAPGGYEAYERCLRSNGVAGGAIGGVIGAIAGNRIAGRGNRLAGSLIGGGLGALAGLGVEKATKKCDRYLPREEYRAPVANRYPQGYPQGYPQQYPTQAGGYGWQGGYYYPQQAAAPVTTVTITPGTQTTTTTTTEEVVYENVYSYAPRKRVVRRHAPRPRPRCGC